MVSVRLNSGQLPSQAGSGGGFQSGSTHDAPPEMIMHSSANPMIFVSFEYRLGALGFLGMPV